jgi:hypothetical protein
MAAGELAGAGEGGSGGGGEEGGRRDPSIRGRTVVGSRVRTSRNGDGWLEEEEQCLEKN